MNFDDAIGQLIGPQNDTEMVPPRRVLPGQMQSSDWLRQLQIGAPGAPTPIGPSTGAGRPSPLMAQAMPPIPGHGALGSGAFANPAGMPVPAQPPVMPQAPQSLGNLANDFNKLMAQMPVTNSKEYSFTPEPPDDRAVQKLLNMGVHDVAGVLGARVAGGRTPELPQPHRVPSPAETALGLMGLQAQQNIAGMQFGPDAMQRGLKAKFIEDRMTKGDTLAEAEDDWAKQNRGTTSMPTVPGGPAPTVGSDQLGKMFWESRFAPPVGPKIVTPEGQINIPAMSNLIGAVQSNPAAIPSMAAYMSQLSGLGGAEGVLGLVGPNYVKGAEQYPEALGKGMSVKGSQGTLMFSPSKYKINTPTGSHDITVPRVLRPLELHPFTTAAEAAAKKQELGNTDKLIQALVELKNKQKQK